MPAVAARPDNLNRTRTSVLAPTRPAAHARPQQRAIPLAAVIVGVVTVSAVAVGLFMRLWLIFHAPTTSDEDIAGLIAQGALHGHFLAFYGGQAYGGTAEPYVIALAFLVFGQSGVVAEFVVGALGVVAAVLTWRIALRLTPPNIALLAGALAWAAPAVAVRDSVRVYGFRGVTIVCGLGLILVALRILDGHRRAADFIALGLLAGVGWWSSPEIIYYTAPTALLLGMAVVHSPHRREWWPSGFIALGAAIVGALPWIWANVGSRLASLHGPTGPPPVRFGGRLSIFFHYALPMETGLRRADDGAWVVGPFHTLAFIAVMAVIVVALVLCLFAGGRALAIAAGVLAFPILYAISPYSWYWQDGRYAGYLVPLLALIVAVGSSEALRRLRGPRSAAALGMAGVVTVSVVLAVVGLHQIVNLESVLYTSGWSNPDAPTLAAIPKLEAAGITTGYADYWVAYKLDFLSRGRLNITTAGYDTDRSPTINAAVQRSNRTAWLFVPPNEAILEGTQFTGPPLIVGPDTVTESQFTATLRQLGVSYRVVDTGILRAVIPDRTLTPYEVKMPGALPPGAAAEISHPARST